MSLLDRRLRVQIDEGRWSRLQSEAARRGVAVAVVMREAMEARFPGDADERRAAPQSTLDADPIEVPGPEELAQELGGLGATLTVAQPRSCGAGSTSERAAATKVA